MKKIITLIAVTLLFISCSSSEENEIDSSLFTGVYLMKGSQNGVCSGKIFLDFNENSLNILWRGPSNCDLEPTYSDIINFNIINENIIEVTNGEKGFLRLVNNGNNSYTFCFSDNSATIDNLSFGECYILEK